MNGMILKSFWVLPFAYIIATLVNFALTGSPYTVGYIIAVVILLLYMLFCLFFGWIL